MKNKKDKWAVVVWEYGRHADEFDIIKVIGPYSFKEASEKESQLDQEGDFSKHADIARFEMEKETK